MNSRYFCFSSNVLTSSFFWRIVLLDIEFLTGRFILSALYICHPIVFCSPWFLKRNLLLIWLEIPCILQVTLLLLIARFSYYLWLLTVWYNVSQSGSLWFTLLGIWWDSWVSRFMFVCLFFQTLQVLTIVYSVILSAFLTSPFKMFFMQMLVCWCPTVS